MVLLGRWSKSPDLKSLAVAISAWIFSFMGLQISSLHVKGESGFLS